MYSIILTLVARGSLGEFNMRFMVAAVKPEALWVLLSIVQAVLLGNPKALA
jgi:hypothetical protein